MWRPRTRFPRFRCEECGHEILVAFSWQHQRVIWAANPLALTLIVLIGFFGTYHLFSHAPKVKGF